MSLFGDVLTNPVVLVALGGTAVKLADWLYKKRRNNEIKDNFIQAMATNHLPHIYHVQTLICNHLDIPVTEPPAINFVDLDKKT